jgi:protein-S-isoprenylcysteine O-methyltransferase Ste14
MEVRAPEDDNALKPDDVRTRPASCANGWVALSGLVGFLLSLALMYRITFNPIHRSLLALVATALPMVVLDVLVLRVHHRPSTGLLWPATRPNISDVRALERVLVKLLGLAGTLATIGACYWLFPIYREHFYGPYWAALRAVSPWFAIAVVPYFFYVDQRMAKPCDGYWHAGMAVLGRLENVDGALLRQYALGWIIKGYFLPLMFVYLTNTIGSLLSFDILGGEVGFLRFYRLAWDLAFAVDLVFAAVGYCLTMRLIDSHIRWPEPTMLGWAVTLACYQPFASLIFGRYLEYNDELWWNTWVASIPALQVLWGSVIVALLTVYAVSTTMFGCRFSNLTHRGILTHGPYRWTKHPSYISKNLVWWLVSVPFVSSTGFDEAVRHSLLLLGVNAIYFLRARTEERHLSRDSVYVAYALWIEQHGLLRIMGRVLPFLRYLPPSHMRD